MVNGETAVLPAAAAFESDKASALPLADGAVASFSRSRSSRLCHNDGWITKDNYSQSNTPENLFNASKWKGVYKCLDESWVNGTIERRWTRGKEEFRYILLQCKDVLGKESFYGEKTSSNTSSEKIHLYLRLASI